MFWYTIKSVKTRWYFIFNYFNMRNNERLGKLKHICKKHLHVTKDVAELFVLILLSKEVSYDVHLLTKGEILDRYIKGLIPFNKQSPYYKRLLYLEKSLEKSKKEA